MKIIYHTNLILSSNLFYDREEFKTVLGLKKKMRQWNLSYNI